MYDVVYFSSVSENTKRLVEKLGLHSVRIPLKTEEAASFTYGRDSVLVVPTYGSGEEKTSVPKQVIKFLNNPENRKFLLDFLYHVPRQYPRNIERKHFF